MPRKLATIKHEKILRSGQKQDVFNQNPAQASEHLKSEFIRRTKEFEQEKDPKRKAKLGEILNNLKQYE